MTAPIAGTRPPYPEGIPDSLREVVRLKIVSLDKSRADGAPEMADAQTVDSEACARLIATCDEIDVRFDRLFYASQAVVDAALDGVPMSAVEEAIDGLRSALREVNS